MNLEFKDYKGNDISVGDKIKIISEYSINSHSGHEAIVTWNSGYGRYEFKYFHKKHKCGNFYNVKKFVLVEKHTKGSKIKECRTVDNDTLLIVA